MVIWKVFSLWRFYFQPPIVLWYLADQRMCVGMTSKPVIQSLDQFILVYHSEPMHHMDDIPKRTDPWEFFNIDFR